jgi:hypothetical protein
MFLQSDHSDHDDKTPRVIPTVQHEPSGATDKNVDEAWQFLDQHRDAECTAIDLKALRRKIDWHIVPLLFCCYTMQFLDKVILNVCRPLT